MDSLWSVASALQDAVKKQTSEITASLQNTDWKTEISALQEGLKDDTVEISQKAKEVTEELGHKTMHVAKKLPQAVDEGRRKAVAQLEQLPGSSAARAKEAAAHLQEAGASLSQMGHRVVVNTSEMFDHFSNAIQAEMNAAQDRDLNKNSFRGGGGVSSSRSINRGNEATKFSRFDADVAAMQRDSSTYCDEPDDKEDFENWVAGFDLPSRKPDIAKILNENTFMSELQARIVPVIVDYESFWTRYFYRFHKLEERHVMHAKVAALASRTAQMEEDNLGWGTDGEEEEVEVETDKEPNKGIAVQEYEDEDGVEPAVAKAAAETGNDADLELNKPEEDVGEAEIEPDTAEIDESKPLEAPTAEEEEEDKGDDAVATDGRRKEEVLDKAPAVESGTKDKTVATKKVTDATKDEDKEDDDFSSLDFSGAEDIGEGEDRAGDSDWNEDDVAEWE